MKQNTLTTQAVIRGLVHIFVGLALAAIVYLFPRNWALFLIGLGTFLVLLFDFFRLRMSGLREWFQGILHVFLRSYESERMLGASFLLAAALFTAVVFSKEICILALSFIAVGDAVAGIIGRRFGKTRLFSKTLEGTLAGMAGCIVVGLAWLSLGLNATIPVILTGAVSAAVIESLPLPVNDNISMPIGSGVVMALVALVSH